MRFAQVFASAATVFSTVSAQTPTVYDVVTKVAEPITRTTTVTEDYVYWCPEPTTFVHKNATYTAHEAMWMTITNCPCTVTYTTPVYPDTTYSPDCVTLTTDGTVITLTYPPTNPPDVPPATTIGHTIPVAPTTTEPVVVPTVGAANKASAGFGALAIAGVAALIL
ncbi:hypothetical protein G7Z17_g3088 [Cylindrodendrum hubeiense]|uniref:Cell wall protein SED1 n=1 Tax=Cylindrodendrum hubeiense TaxID=595255 RepID=A0A9P5HFD0_9HYPO|nr:hypothetical protein G7Z17_g3088 [Cylindrodendrum hubeiense]